LSSNSGDLHLTDNLIYVESSMNSVSFSYRKLNKVSELDKSNSSIDCNLNNTDPSVNVKKKNSLHECSIILTG